MNVVEYRKEARKKVEAIDLAFTKDMSIDELELLINYEDFNLIRKVHLDGDAIQYSLGYKNRVIIAKYFKNQLIYDGLHIDWESTMSNKELIQRHKDIHDEVDAIDENDSHASQDYQWSLMEMEFVRTEMSKRKMEFPTY